MIEMELDHETGALDGDVLRSFAGRRLSAMSEADLMELMRECRQTTPRAPAC